MLTYQGHCSICPDPYSPFQWSAGNAHSQIGIDSNDAENGMPKKKKAPITLSWIS